MIAEAFDKAVKEREAMDREREAMEVLFKRVEMPEDIGDVAKRFCKHMNVAVKDLLVDSHEEEFVRLKALFCAYTDPKFGTTEVGRFIGRDHSTVNYHRNNHVNLMVQDEQYKRNYQLLRLMT